jgi:hypothetical protein
VDPVVAAVLAPCRSDVLRYFHWVKPVSQEVLEYKAYWEAKSSSDIQVLYQEG